jgi:quinoprotein glucose dehydrogenase
VKRDGKLVDAVAQTMKVGHLFLLDRETGEPLFPSRSARSRAPSLAGEVSWPTQPFPTRPPPTRASASPRPRSRTSRPQARDAILKQLRGMRTGDVFLPPGPAAERRAAAVQRRRGMGRLGLRRGERAALREREQRGRVALDGAGEAGGEMTLNEIGPAPLPVGLLSTATAAAGARSRGLKGPRAPPDIEKTIGRGRGQMPAFAMLKPLELRALSAFLLGEGRTRTRRRGP